jgi:hypothetical protein
MEPYQGLTVNGEHTTNRRLNLAKLLVQMVGGVCVFGLVVMCATLAESLFTPTAGQKNDSVCPPSILQPTTLQPDLLSSLT